MKHSANYSIVRKSFVNSCDNELRGINATCKVIFAYSSKFSEVFNEDGVDANIFASSANVVDLFREKLPQIYWLKIALRYYLTVSMVRRLGVA